MLYARCLYCFKNAKLYAEYGATLQTIVLLHDGKAPAREMQSTEGNARIITLK